jgi:hypothetical protein
LNARLGAGVQWCAQLTEGLGLRCLFWVTLLATTEDLATWPSVAKQVADTPACVESRIVKVRALLLFAYWKR